MKSWVFFGLCIIALLLFSTGAPAETRYIKTIVKITLRTGPGLDHKIISMITSGKSVELLETEGEWSRIQTEKGKIGWIMTRLISAEKPSRPMPEIPAAENEALLERQASLHEEIDRLNEENKRLESELTDSHRAPDTSNESNRSSQEAAGELQKLKSDLEKAKAALEEQEDELRQRESRITGFRMQPDIWWFLSGAGVLILGFIIGYFMSRSRRRSLLS